MRAFVFSIAVLALGNACKMQEEPTADPAVSKPTSSAAASRPSSPTPSTPRIRFVKAPPDDVETTVRAALATAKSENRDLIVYVGATWCEPCQRFHAAAERGEIDDVLSAITFLEFDLDRDSERLASAGYTSQYIPLFAIPKTDGSASGKQFDGSIKGAGAVADITPKLRKLLGK